MSKKVWNSGCSGISFDAFYIPLALLLQNTLHQATLAVIIILAVLSLIRIEPIPEAWRVSRRDGVFAVLTFLITLALAPQLHWGILVDADAHDLTLDPFIAIIRFDDRLYFGAARFFEDRVLEALVRLPELRYLILNAGGINQIDATGVQTLARRAGPS